MKRDLSTRLNKQDLFEAGIVDVVMCRGVDDPEPIDKILESPENIYKCTFGSIDDKNNSDKLYSRKPIDFDLTEYNLGISLGYPPKCVELWCKYFNLIISGISTQKHDFCMNYNGIKFNIMGLFRHSIEWCITQYDDNVIKMFHTSEFVLFSEQHNFSIRRTKDKNNEIITVNGGLFNGSLSQLIYFLNKYLR